MTDDDPQDRVLNGEISHGLRRYYRSESVRGDKDMVEIKKQKRMHRFDSGYHDRGPALSLTHRLTETDARAVRDLLDDWLSERDSDE